MTRCRGLLMVLAAFALSACEQQSRWELAPTIVMQESGTTVLLQAVSVVDEDTVWVSGHGGTYATTTDGGATWEAGVVPGADTLQFRDVYAVNGSVVYLLSAGEGELSRIYKTTDGGDTWTLQFTNTDSAAFFDCFDFWDADHGLAFSDAVDGSFVILRTEDGGANWNRIPPEVLPPAQDGEGSFAASGTCLVTVADRFAWVGTGAAAQARIFYTEDRGSTWSVAPTPIAGGQASGIASLAFSDTLTGWAFGGDIGDRGTHTDNVVRTDDGGRSWRVLAHPWFTGAIYGSSHVPNAPYPTLVVVGPGGLEYTIDGGESWVSFDSIAYWAVGFASPAAGWAVGPDGRIARVGLYR